MKKIVFFDIDGTIWNRKFIIPNSTKKAIQTLKNNGHKVFINTGRSKGFVISKELFDIKFDGMIFGCGTRLEYKNRVIYENVLDKEIIPKNLELMKKIGIEPILEGSNHMYMREKIKGTTLWDKLTVQVNDGLKTVEDYEDNWEVSKFTCFNVEGKEEVVKQTFEKDFSLLWHDGIVELLPKGHSKAIAMKKICDLLNYDIKDSIAFGDSGNDEDMLKTAGIGVAMGNGSDIAKQSADFITKDLDENGIEYALKKFKLI